jgi:hypothetical protein
MANNKIQVKRTSVSGRTANVTSAGNSQYIAAGELALNMPDGILYSSNGSALITVGANLVNQAVTNTLTLGNSLVNATINSTAFTGSANSATYLGSSINSGNSTGIYSTGVMTASGIVSGSELTSTLASGDEGGQINLAKPPNANTAGGVTIDAYQNKLRIFEQGGNARGAYIDLTECANGVGTNLLGGTGTVTSVASANGIAGGPITGSGTLYAVAGNSTVFVNASGIHVNTSSLPTVNLSSQYVWTNTHTFQANVAFTGNNISVVTNTGSVMFGGAGDTNWRIGRSTGATTKFYYSNNTLDIIAAASNLEGVVIGQPGGNTYLETGYAGTFTRLPIYIGNSVVNVSINSTSFTGTANNTSFVGSVSAANVVSNAQLSANLANYQTSAGLSANVATLTANNTSFVGAVSAANVVSNAQLSANLANYQTTAGLSANVATLTANNTSFVGAVSAANVVSNSQLSSNLANYQTSAGLSANVATLTANNANFVKANNGITSNSSGVFVTQGDGTTVNSTGVHVRAGNTQLISNSTGVWANQANFDHNSLSNYDANKHVDHTTVTLTAGAGLTGGGTIAASRTFDVGAGNGISVAADAVAVSGGNTLTVNSTGVHVNSTLQVTTLTASGNVVVEGNLTVSGNVTVIGANNLSIVDNFIYLNSNNTTQNIDLGFAGNYNDGTYKHAGFFRDASDGFWKPFDGYTPEPDAAVDIDTSNNSFNIAGMWFSNTRIGNTTVYATINSTAYSGSANNSTYLGGYTFAAPPVIGSSTANGISLTYANVTGQVNTATFYATTSANIASAVQANATGVWTTGTVNAATHSVGSSFIANSTALVSTGYANVSGNGYFGGNVGIGNTASSIIALNLAKTYASDATLYGIYGAYIDSNTSLTADRGRYGYYSILENTSQNKTAAGATTFNGNYYGAILDVYNGDNSTGGNARAGTIEGLRLRVYQTANGASANTVDTMHGNYNILYQQGSGTVTVAYGTRNLIQATNNSVTGNITTAYGFSSVIESNTAMTIGNGYLFRGVHLGSTTTTPYGIHLTGETINYLSGNLGIGNTAPNAKLQVTGTANVSGNVAIAGITTFSANVILGSSGLSANGGFGTSGHILHSNGTATYWAADDQGVTSVSAGNGIISSTGGAITATGTLYVDGANGISVTASGVNVLAGTGVVSNTSGVHANATYIQSVNFPSGTVMIFAQATAPTGWTKLTSLTNAGLRLVSGATGGTTGGTQNFATVLNGATTVSGTTDGTTLANSTSAIHSHRISTTFGSPGFYSDFTFSTTGLANVTTTAATTRNRATDTSGGGGAHDHTYSSTFSFDIKYIDVIQCSKD